jgi:ABC-type antimicrobial peptide transport system permease subunit
LDRKERFQRALIGFVAGFIMGYGLSYLMLLFYNWLCQWMGKEPFTFTFWSAFPVGILVALSMAINMMNPPFGD